MIRMSRQTPRLHLALAGVSLVSVLFLGVVGVLHQHDEHHSETCDLCHQLDHLGLDTPVLLDIALDDRVADAVPFLPALPAIPGDRSADPARAPPVYS